MQFTTYKEAQVSPLAKALLAIEGIERVFFGKDFVTVTLKKDFEWLVMKPQVFAAITDFFTGGEPLILQQQAAPADPNAQINPDDDEVTAMIKELIFTRIRGNIQEDGGDIQFRGFKNGIVYVELQGSCVGCASSSVTLKHGIENMLMHYIPEVEAVESIEPQETQAAMEDEEVHDHEEDIPGGDLEELDKLEKLEGKAEQEAELAQQEDFNKLQAGLAKVKGSHRHRNRERAAAEQHDA